MSDSGNNADASLAAARAGSRVALGELLEKYRNYLLLIARQELDPAMQSKEGASDLVQETFLEAQKDFARFQGNSEEELLAWLRKLLRNNLANCARRYRSTGKRRIDREVSLENCRSGASSPNRPAVPSPSEQVIADEQAHRVQESLDRLPSHYRRVLLLRCRDNLSFEEIGRRIKRTRNAAQKLWARAVERMQQEMEGSP